MYGLQAHPPTTLVDIAQDSIPPHPGQGKHYWIMTIMSTKVLYTKHLPGDTLKSNPTVTISTVFCFFYNFWTLQSLFRSLLALQSHLIFLWVMFRLGIPWMKIDKT